MASIDTSLYDFLEWEKVDMVSAPPDKIKQYFVQLKEIKQLASERKVSLKKAWQIWSKIKKLNASLQQQQPPAPSTPLPQTTQTQPPILSQAQPLTSLVSPIRNIANPTTPLAYSNPLIPPFYDPISPQHSSLFDLEQNNLINEALLPSSSYQTGQTG